MSLNNMMIEPIIPLWLILLLLALGLVAAIIQYGLIQRKLGPYKALGISILRLCALSLVISFGLNPSLVERREHRVPQTLAILMDVSPGMGLSVHKGKGDKLDEAKALLLDGPKPLLKSLSERFDVRLYALGESMKAIEAGELASLKAGEKRADLTDALRKFNGKNSLTLLFSDGNLKWENSDSANPPFFIIPLGDPKGYKDILIKAVKAPALAFRGREVSIDVTIKSYGFMGLTLPVALKDGNRLLTAKNVHLNQNPAEMTVSLTFTPEKLGQHNLYLSIPSQVGESLTSNNHVNLSLKVIRDKIRILMVSGSPSLNYRFMRMVMKNDPSIDLLSFVILRTPSDVLNVPLQEQSLIPFPVETLFSKELNNFDLLIFDNFPFHLYSNLKHLEKVREFIRDGGGFAMVGGPNLLDGGRYTGTSIEETLPVKLTGKEDYHRASSFEVKLSHAGVTHPITQFSQDENENLTLWREMPALDGINLLEPKNLKNVLLESADGNFRPILTVGNYGKGRVLVLATDYSWKWYMGMVAKGKGNWAYPKLMGKMVRWLTKDPDLDPIQITLLERAGTIGQEFEFRVHVKEKNFSKNLREMVTLSVFDPDGVKIGSQLKTPGQSGEYLGSFIPRKGGMHRVKIETSTGYIEEFVAIAGPLENIDTAPDHERLKTISASTGGKFLSGGDNLIKEMESYAERSKKSFIEEKQFPLWGMPYTLIVILALLGTEWVLRRKWGLK